MMAGDDEKFVFTMIDAMGRGNRKRAFQLVINNLSSAKNTSDRDGIALSITGLLTSQFELMYDSLEVYSPGKSSPMYTFCPLSMMVYTSPMWSAI